MKVTLPLQSVSIYYFGLINDSEIGTERERKGGRDGVQRGWREGRKERKKGGKSIALHPGILDSQRIFPRPKTVTLMCKWYL